jgi:hypothetical protein
MSVPRSRPALPGLPPTRRSVPPPIPPPRSRQGATPTSRSHARVLAVLAADLAAADELGDLGGISAWPRREWTMLIDHG